MKERNYGGRSFETGKRSGECVYRIGNCHNNGKPESEIVSVLN